MKLLYIAGKYRAYRSDGNYDISTMFERTMDMRLVAKKYLEQGYAVIAPLLNTFLLDSKVIQDGEWLEIDKTLLSKCDAIVLTRGWSGSQGALAELQYAKELGLEIIVDE